MDFKRIETIATNGFREAIRDRVLYFVGFYAVLVVAAGLLLPDLSGGRGAANKIVLDVGVSAMALLSAAIAIIVGTGLIAREIEKRTLLMLLPKPVTKLEFIVGRHLGLSGVLAVSVAAMTAIYMGLFALIDVPYPLGTLLVASVFAVLELVVVVAIAILFGTFTTPLIAMLLSFGTYVMGHFSRDIVAAGELSGSRLVMWICQGLYLILPDLERFNLRSDAVYGLLPSFLQLATSAIYGLLYTALLLAIATYTLSRRQF